MLYGLLDHLLISFTPIHPEFPHGIIILEIRYDKTSKLDTILPQLNFSLFSKGTRLYLKLSSECDKLLKPTITQSLHGLYTKSQ